MGVVGGGSCDTGCDEHFNPAVARPAFSGAIVCRRLGFSRTWVHYNLYATQQSFEFVLQRCCHCLSAPVTETNVIRYPPGAVGMTNQTNDFDWLGELPTLDHGIGKVAYHAR